LVRDGLLKESPYVPDKFVVKRPEQKTAYLDEEEIERIIKFRPKLSDKMKVNADRFLFSCYTGFRYSDMVSVRWSDVKSNGTITKRMVKTRLF
jgi:integrase